MAMALADLGLAIDGPRQAAGLQAAVLATEAHGAAQVSVLIAALHLAGLGQPLGDQGYDRMGGLGIELGAVGTLQAGHVAGVFDDGHLHAEADPQVGDAVLAGVAHRLDLALDAALAEAARDEDGVDPQQAVGALALDALGIHVAHPHPGMGLDPGVGQGLGQGLVGLGEIHVLADHAHRDLADGLVEAVQDPLPLVQVRRRGLQAELGHHQVIQSLGVQQHGDAVDVVGVDAGDDGVLRHIGEEGDLAPLRLGDVLLRPTHQDVGLDADGPQLLDRVLGGLGLDLAGGLDVRHQGQVHEEGVLAPLLHPHLADGLQEGQGFDIAHGAADLHHGDIG